MVEEDACDACDLCEECELCSRARESPKMVDFKIEGGASWTEGTKGAEIETRSNSPFRTSFSWAVARLFFHRAAAAVVTVPIL